MDAGDGLHDAGADRPTPIGIGDLLPDVGLIDHEGRPWRFGDHRGRPLVLIAHRHLA